MTPLVEMYTSPLCGSCHAAKRLLVRKHVAFAEEDVSRHASLRGAMVKRARARSVPWVFVGDAHVGGCDDLYALDCLGRLDPRLAG